MLLTEKMQQPIFSTTEQIVIDYLIEEREKITNKTIKEIASETFVSPSILIRISNKLGYSGWTSFKKDFLHEVNYLDTHFQQIDANYPFTKKDSLTKISNKIGTLAQETISDTLHLLHHDDLHLAAQLLNDANKIKIFASNINIYLAQDFVHKLNRIKKDISIITLDGEQLFQASNLEKDTLAILISYSGENRTITSLIPILKHNDVKILSITNMGENSLSREATCSLKISTREKLYSKIASFSSHYSICFLLDILYASLFSLDYDKNLTHTIALSQLHDPRTSHIEALKEKEG